MIIHICMFVFEYGTARVFLLLLFSSGFFSPSPPRYLLDISCTRRMMKIRKYISTENSTQMIPYYYIAFNFILMMPYYYYIAINFI